MTHTVFDPRAKVLVFIAMAISSFFIISVMQVIVSATLLVVLGTYLKVKTRYSLKPLGAVGAFLAVLALCNMLIIREGTVLFSWSFITITNRGVLLALLFSYRLLVLFAGGLLLVMSTSQAQLTDAFEAMLRPLKPLQVPCDEIALTLALALRFIPTLSAELKQINEAQFLRGATLTKKSPVKRLQSLIANLIPLLSATMRHVHTLSLALDAKGWNEKTQRTHLYPLRFTKNDGILITATVIYCVVLFFLR